MASGQSGQSGQGHQAQHTGRPVKRAAHEQTESSASALGKYYEQVSKVRKAWHGSLRAVALFRLSAVT